jgi:hypothetical protein
MACAIAQRALAACNKDRRLLRVAVIGQIAAALLPSRLGACLVVVRHLSSCTLIWTPG